MNLHLIKTAFYGTILISGVFLMSCQTKSNQVVAQDSTESSIEKITKSDEEWKAELSKLEYKVLRKAGTERAFTGDLWDNKEKGTYICQGCQLPLFHSDTKYKSGTGWPSYYQPIDEEHIGKDTDHILGYARTEVHCARCDGHLGHVFEDGPEPTGLRYCINSVSMDFIPEK